MKELNVKYRCLTKNIFFSILFWSCAVHVYATIEPKDLRCEYRVNPLGIDTTTPRLSWKIIDPEQTRGQKQTAYQIIVSESVQKLKNNIGDYWDSGKVSSDRSVHVSYSGKALVSGAQYFWKVRVWDVAGVVSDWSVHGLFSMGLLQKEDWKGEWIHKKDQNKKDHNWYRKDFTLQETPISGFIHIASFGYHEVYVNGKKASVGVMNPVASAMKKRLPYITYNIKEYLKPGANVIGVWHAAGWARWGRIKEYYDPPFVFKAQAEIKTNTTEVVLETNTTWKCKKSYSSYYGAWDILGFGGEVIDERLREDDWNTTAYDDRDWANAVIFDDTHEKEVEVANIHLGPKGAVRVPSTDANPPSGKITATLSAQMVEPQVKYKTMQPIDVKQHADGRYVIDMGQNYTGYFEMNLYNGVVGDSIVFEISDQIKQTTTYAQKSIYIYGKTGEGHFTNRFNLAGGRWVTVYGLTYKPDLKDIKGHVITNDRKQIGQFESSSKLLNKIYQTNLNTYLANTIDGILVDCPHRERRGWGEVTVAAMYGDALPNFESGAYMAQYAQFMQDAQADDGKIRAVINGDDFNFLMWMANSPITIWETYRMLGDKRLLEQHYAAMKKWMHWLYKHSNYDTGGALIIGERGSLEFPGLGDWCTPRGNFWSASNSPESAHFNNCVYAFMLDCAKDIAQTLDKVEDAKLYEDRLAVQQQATHQQSYDPATGKYGEGHQVNQAFALLAGVTPSSEKQKVYDQMVDQVLYKFPYYDTGSSGQALYTRYFTEYGERMDLIYELLQDTSHPSYGYFLDQGRTVWPERWSAIGSSQIHTCYTGIGGYFIKGFGGIRPDTTHLGMQHFIIKPAPVGDLIYANTSYQSMYGNSIVNWKKEATSASYHIEIPVNTSAKVYLPATTASAVKESGVIASNSQGITYIGAEKSDAVGNYEVFRVTAGIYDFEVNNLPQTSYPLPLNQSENLAMIGRMNASSMMIKSAKLPVFEAFRANDGTTKTVWKAQSIANEWLEIAWITPQTFNKIVVKERANNITKYNLQYWSKNRWIDLIADTAIGTSKVFRFKTIVSNKCRLLVSQATDLPMISEFEVYRK